MMPEITQEQKESVIESFVNSLREFHESSQDMKRQLADEIFGIKYIIHKLFGEQVANECYEIASDQFSTEHYPINS